MKQNFAVMPSVSISRSKFRRTSQHKTSFNLGQIVPIYLDEVLPGDTRNISMASLVRMSNPVAPLMDNIYMDYYAFFIPARLAWTHWKEFMGENTTSAGIYTGPEYLIPTIDIMKTGNNITTGSLGDYFGLPLTSVDNTKSLPVNVLPYRCYMLVYNRWFRDQNLIAPKVISLGDTETSIAYAQAPLYAAKTSDYFTRALPFVQKGAPVTIPLGTSAPVYTGANNPTLTSQVGLKWLDTSGNVLVPTNSLHLGISDGTGNTMAQTSDAFTGSPTRVAPANLYADLSQATAATINQLRFAFQYQKLLEKDSAFGSRYWEILHAHFGVNAPDASLQDPEFLGHQRLNINIDQVLQTTGSDKSTPANNELGDPGANSVSGSSGNLFTKSFTEHGYILIVAVARHDQTYGQGVNRLFSRSQRTDFYFPVFANLGSQEIKNKELFATGGTTDNQVFGFQEAWAEYRYKPSIVSGLLKPNATSNLGYWTLSNNFASLPTLSQSFIEQDRSNLSRALVTGNNGPDFIADFYFTDIAVRPMPMYSVPGLIDHH